MIRVTFLDAVTFDVLETWGCSQVPAEGEHVGLDGDYWHKVGRVQWHGPYRVEVFVMKGGEKYKP